MRLMADRVGPEGTVTGIEIDGALGAEALLDLRREGGAEFEQITADLLKLEEPAGAPFDLTFCRLPAHADARSCRRPRKNGGLDQAMRRGGGTGIRFRLDRRRADVPCHGRVQPSVREGVQAVWTEYARRTAAAGAV